MPFATVADEGPVSPEDAPLLIVRNVRFHERALPFRRQDRGGEEAAQAFVRVRIQTETGAEGWGQAAALLPAADPDAHRRCLGAAGRHYLDLDMPATAFDAHSEIAGQLAAQPDNAGAARFAQGLIDRAVIDALCGIHEMPIAEAVRENLPGMDGSAIPALAGFDLAGWLGTLTPEESITVRHRISADAPASADAVTDWLDDGLPETLEEVVAAYGYQHFTAELGGDMEADAARLTELAAVLEPQAYRVVLHRTDAADGQPPADWWERVARTPGLERLCASVAGIVDTADTDAVFLSPADGNTGTVCKADADLYPSLIDAALAAHNGDAALWAVDSPAPPGIAVQQQLAWTALLGIPVAGCTADAFADGFGGASPEEQEGFLLAHPDLYRFEEGTARVRIQDGHAEIGSLAVPGFGCAAEPDWSSLAEVAYAAGE